MAQAALDRIRKRQREGIDITLQNGVRFDARSLCSVEKEERYQQIKLWGNEALKRQPFISLLMNMKETIKHNIIVETRQKRAFAQIGQMLIHYN